MEKYSKLHPSFNSVDGAKYMVETANLIRLLLSSTLERSDCENDS